MEPSAKEPLRERRERPPAEVEPAPAKKPAIEEKPLPQATREKKPSPAKKKRPQLQLEFPTTEAEREAPQQTPAAADTREAASETREAAPRTARETREAAPETAHETREAKSSTLPRPHAETREATKSAPIKPYIAKGMFSKAVLKEGIDLLPGFPDTDSLEEAREYLKKNMHFSAVSTRNRYASYVLNRLFPKGIADAPLRRFAQKFAGRQELRDVCFYRFCQAEPLVLDVIEQLVIPSIGAGRLGRDRIKEYLAGRYGASGYVKDCTQAIVEAMTASGFVKSEKGFLTFGYREPLVASFAFVLHSEFPDPDMYHIDGLYENRGLRSMLWNPERYLSFLYELRNRRLLSKVSEIDRFRQFTTQWTLGELIAHLEAQR